MSPVQPSGMATAACRQVTDRFRKRRAEPLPLAQKDPEIQ